MTALVAATGSTANNITQSQQWKSKNSSTEVGGNTAGSLKRSCAPNPTCTPPKQQQRLSISIRRPGLRNQSEESATQEEEEQIPPPIRRSSKRSLDAAGLPSSKKRNKKKRRKRDRKSDLVPILEPLHPLKVKIVERIKAPEYNNWARPNGVELLVQAAELASRQNPTPPPEENSDKPVSKSPPPLLPIGEEPVVSKDSVNNNSEIPEPEEEDSQPMTVVVADDEDDGKLMIADEVNLNGSNGRDSGMANDDDDDDSAGALDLSSKSSRVAAPTTDESSSKPQGDQPRKSVSPQLIQQRSTALHSITDSLAQRQRQRLIEQQQEQHKRRVPAPIQQHHPDAIRNLVTLSQTASLVPPHPERAATQRLIVAMHQFAAAAAARAASSPPRPPPNKPPQPSKSLSYGLLRRPFWQNFSSYSTKLHNNYCVFLFPPFSLLTRSIYNTFCFYFVRPVCRIGFFFPFFFNL